MTVSRVLRGEGESQFSDRVMAAVKELDYVPVRSALQNRHVKTRSIGVLLDGEFVFESLVGFQTFSGLSQAAFEAGYDLLLLQPKGHRSLEVQKMQVLDRRCDGFIFVVPSERPEVLEALVENGFPAVTCYSADVPPGICSVVPHNGVAIKQAVELLTQQGHQKIAMWCASDGHSDARERKVAYEQAMRNSGLKPFAKNFDGMRGLVVLEELLKKGITAVICHNDQRALGLWNAANVRGLRVPEELSLVGVDDIEEANERGLTTFTNPFRTIGREAVTTMLALLQGSAPSSPCKRIPMPLVQRSSVAPLKRI